MPHEGPLRAFGETTLRLKDPDGISVVLVGVDLPSPAPLQDPIAPTRLRGVTLFSEDAKATAQFVARFGTWRPRGRAPFGGCCQAQMPSISAMRRGSSRAFQARGSSIIWRFAPPICLP